MRAQPWPGPLGIEAGRGHVYGTIVVDASTGRAIDRPPGRKAGPLADWLMAHPGARVICRDCADASVQAARCGA